MPKISLKQRELNKARIVDVAGELFYKNGYTKTSVNDIIKVVGISKGNFYNYFDSKEDVFFQIVNDVDEVIINYARNQQGKITPEELMMAYIRYRLERFFVERNRQNAKYAFEYYASVDLSEARSALMTQRYEEFLEDIHSVIELGQKSGVFVKKHDSKTVVKVLMALIDGMIFHDSVLDIKITKEKIECVNDIFMTYLRYE